MPKERQKFIMDLDSVLDFIFCPEEKRGVETNIEEKYIKDIGNSNMVLDSRIKKESKTSNVQHENFRYDFLRKMIDIFDDTDWDEEEERPGIQTTSEEICFNTLLQYGFIKKV